MGSVDIDMTSTPLSEKKPARASPAAKRAEKRVRTRERSDCRPKGKPGKSDAAGRRRQKRGDRRHGGDDGQGRNRLGERTDTVSVMLARA